MGGGAAGTGCPAAAIGQLSGSCGMSRSSSLCTRCSGRETTVKFTACSHRRASVSRSKDATDSCAFTFEAVWNRCYCAIMRWRRHKHPEIGLRSSYCSSWWWSRGDGRESCGRVQEPVLLQLLATSGSFWWWCRWIGQEQCVIAAKSKSRCCWSCSQQAAAAAIAAPVSTQARLLFDYPEILTTL